MALTAVAAAAIATAFASVPACADEAKTVTVGAILPITGFLSTLGPPERDAMQMGIEEINKGGFEVGGQHYKLTQKVLDDESNPASVGVTNYRQPVDVDKVPDLVIAAGTRNYEALFRRSRLPVLISTTTARRRQTQAKKRMASSGTTVSSTGEGLPIESNARTSIVDRLLSLREPVLRRAITAPVRFAQIAQPCHFFVVWKRASSGDAA